MTKTLAENIRCLRKQHPMTQEQLAEALGVSVGAVHKWETGRSVPNLELLLSLAEVFSVSTDVLLGYTMQDKDKAAISRTVAELEHAGMIARQERNGNRYRALLTLTPQGVDAAQSVSERARIAVEQAGVGLADDQRQIFYQVLSLIAGNLHTICKDGLSK